MNSSRLDLFVKAGKAANKYNKPVIFDPVGVFATKTRSEFVNKLLNEVNFAVPFSILNTFFPSDI